MYSLILKGSEHMGIYISPVVGSEMVQWNYTDSDERNEIQWNDRLSYMGTFGSALDNSAYIDSLST